MPKIVLIDDDYASEILAESLGYHGYNTRRISSYSGAIQSLEEILGADLVILDIIMERPTSAVRVNISGDRTTGMAILRAIRERSPNLPILVLSATNDKDIIEAIGQAKHTTFLSKWNAPSLRDLVGIIEKIIGGSAGKIVPRAFIVHGHDEVEKLALKNYLQNTLGFSEPIILHGLHPVRLTPA